MLDDAPLSQKAAVARGWFGKALHGRMKFTAATAANFEQLLEAIELQANLLEAEVNILKASRTVAEYDAALKLPSPLAIAAAPNVVRFPRGGAR